MMLLRALVVLFPVLCMAADDPVNFSRDVLPVLSEKCLSCHGPDPSSRMANLRLDTREGAIAPRKNGPAVLPGDPNASLLIARIASTNAAKLMPPPRSHRDRLTEKQITTFKRWIEQGAPWGRHWSFEKPVVRPSAQSIDALIRERLAAEGLRMAPEAPRHTLIRRVSLDLTGLPPTPEEVTAFVNDKSPDAYGQLVTRLLNSEHFGERMAMWWLDAARYSDTDGFQADATRTNWPWRDWVVAAFNRNMPFDRFTIEQFAGDLLPGATDEQKLATAFHRNHMTNGEGGRDPEESRIDYVLDRVNTTGTVFLGLTLGCAQCHSHKFDPITHADYYSFSAFFNSIDEDGQAGKKAKPYLPYRSPLVSRAATEAQQLVDERSTKETQVRTEARKPFAAWLAAQRNRKDSTTWHPLASAKMEAAEGTVLTQAADGVVQAGGPNPRQDDYRLTAPVKLPRVTGLRLEVFPHPSHTEGKLSRGASGEFVLTDIKVQVKRRGSANLRDITVADALADFATDKKTNNNYGSVKDTLDDDPRNGWTTKGDDAQKPHMAYFVLAEPLVLAPEEELIFEMRHRSTTGDANIGRFRVSVTEQRGPALQSFGPSPLEELAKGGPLSAPLRERLFEQFLADYQPYQTAKAALDRASRQLEEVKAAGQTDVMVLAERPQPRDTHVLLRGVWDKKGEKVAPATPPAIAPWPQDEARTRLGLARWIVGQDNPLTARVIVNQLWQLMFGEGLVRTPEDFGLQGERPTYPELLDWLAIQFVESGWDVKKLLRLIATSAVYRQDSTITPEMAARDPKNLLLARGPRFRLPSWMLRDAALRNAGLLNPALGGPPVRPYQPEGVWEEIFMGRFRYEPSEGAAQYRRTLYAFWRRTIAPTFLFDSAQRRSCEVRVSRTNTPLQALTLLNDETYLEASRTLAELALSRGKTPEQQIGDLFYRVVSRTPDAKESAALLRGYEQALAHYQKHSADAAALVAVGQRKTAAQPVKLAAMMLAASTILNLDEAITHE